MRRAITTAILAGAFLTWGACDYPGVDRPASELDPALSSRAFRGQQGNPSREHQESFFVSPNTRNSTR